MLFHKADPPANFAGWAFLCLVILFLAIGNSKPVVGMTGLGAVLILAAILVEANKDRVWKQYKRNYKYRKSNLLPKFWSQPSEAYYRLNVYVVWPIMFLLGLASIAAAVYLA